MISTTEPGRYKYCKEISADQFIKETETLSMLLENGKNIFNKLSK